MKFISSNDIRLISAPGNWGNYPDINQYIRETVRIKNVSHFDYLYYTENKNDLDINDLYKSLISKPNFSNLSKIYFDKSSKFPRNKVSAYCNLKRTIKPENSDIYIVPNQINTNDYIGSWTLYKIDFEDKTLYYLIENWISSTVIQKLRNFNNSLFNSKDSDNLIIIKALKYSGLIPNYEKVTTFHMCSINQLTYSLLQTMLTKSYNFASDDELAKFINTQTSTLTQDNFDFLLNLIQSKDEGSQRLALETLCNFNVLETPACIGLLVELCENKRRFNSNSIKQLFSDLKSITGCDFSYSSNQIAKPISYLLKNALELKKEKDIEIIKTYFSKYLRDYLIKAQNEFLNGCNSILNIDILKDEENK